MNIFNDYYKDKRVLVTGHCGFKGSWLAIILQQLGAIVAGYSLLPESSERMFDIVNLHTKIHSNTIDDICNQEQLEKVMHDFQPEIIIHMAA